MSYFKKLTSSWKPPGMSGVTSAFIQPIPLEKTYGQTTATRLKHKVSASVSLQSLCLGENVPGLVVGESVSLVAAPTVMGDAIFLQEKSFSWENRVEAVTGEECPKPYCVVAV